MCSDSAKINDWVSRSTGRTVNYLLPDDEVLTAPIMLTAAAGVKANWTNPFDSFHTWPGEFMSDEGAGMPCEYMHQKGKMKVSSEEERDPRNRVCLSPRPLRRVLRVACCEGCLLGGYARRDSSLRASRGDGNNVHGPQLRHGA